MIFLINDGLYSEINLTEGYVNFIQALLNEKIVIDCYCPQCEKFSTFVGRGIPIDIGISTSKSLHVPSYPTSPMGQIKTWIRKFQAEKNGLLELSCIKDDNHKIEFLLHYDFTNNILSKTGQSPSFIDLHPFNEKEYDKYLGKDYFKEYKKALELAAHGYSIGSYVYFRRIIEKTFENTFDNHQEDIDINRDAFIKLSFTDKTKYIKDYLPDFLQDNTTELYSILSKGIHQLNEIECANAFPILRTGIELILDDIISNKKIKAKKDEISKNLRKIYQQNNDADKEKKSDL